jgi:hypothetical protein
MDYTTKRSAQIKWDIDTRVDAEETLFGFAAIS